MMIKEENLFLFILLSFIMSIIKITTITAVIPFILVHSIFSILSNLFKKQTTKKKMCKPPPLVIDTTTTSHDIDLLHEDTVTPQLSPSACSIASSITLVDDNIDDHCPFQSKRSKVKEMVYFFETVQQQQKQSYYKQSTKIVIQDREYEYKPLVGEWNIKRR
ncbi:uncharacterized protein BX663DRAFT_527785 [Cokeromyces recurvatus]|uniref:uncharacterized protein n=1 Tax=Cokeromyces recurvatus TaxID=90255 RepID=UPI00221F7545|nr:uncharacterized protein BX663DRAFT_527785 [Cokeromyces recurvatus]KAI7897546.1 hypothetical protein BX663DRAFT_527785 [Cokeromyces recurvatus]